jgi:hypothetical protein
VLDGKLDAEVAFVREGKTYAMTLEVTHTIGTIGTSPGVVAPPDEETVATQTRSHEADDRKKLLQGIASPERKAPAP